MTCTFTRASKLGRIYPVSPAANTTLLFRHFNKKLIKIYRVWSRWQAASLEACQSSPATMQFFIYAPNFLREVYFVLIYPFWHVPTELRIICIRNTDNMIREATTKLLDAPRELVVCVIMSLHESLSSFCKHKATGVFQKNNYTVWIYYLYCRFVLYYFVRYAFWFLFLFAIAVRLSRIGFIFISHKEFASYIYGTNREIGCDVLHIYFNQKLSIKSFINYIFQFWILKSLSQTISWFT